MSKLEQNSTSLDEVLAMVNALPDAGGGGGGGASVETCTVTVTSTQGMYSAGYTEYSDGTLDAKSPSVWNAMSLNMENVVVGSMVSVTVYSTTTLNIVTNNATMISNVSVGGNTCAICFKIDGNASIDISAMVAGDWW